MKDAVVEGGLPFNRAYGMNTFNYVGKDARCCDLFKAFMGDYNPMFMKMILEIYKGFEGLNSIVDGGGGDDDIYLHDSFQVPYTQKASTLTCPWF